MYGQTTIGVSESSSRMFRMEVEGLRQNPQTNMRKYPIRQSGATVITVPYNRMSDEYKRITRLGGKIVKIEPVEESDSTATPKKEV
ncbi:phycobilisome linker polypeptide [Spirulina sp. CS-785/01]|uniref:phycobilisome linker polypeptide n=1 Tax=Spirulina sp. CS-785/01 TaxID=3021716 RepID=UPI00232ED1C5|nr:phycobilisome linker polypeptide [Spirulina sp. CS-785/01]MDB9312570.1 phycobilisome linker polypeptide [Spirulina sp. CS-785/01]